MGEHDEKHCLSFGGLLQAESLQALVVLDYRGGVI